MVHITIVSQAPSSSQVVIPTYGISQNPNNTLAYVGAKPKEITCMQNYFQSFQQVQDPSLVQVQFPPQVLHNQVAQVFVAQPHHTQQVNFSSTKLVYQPQRKQQEANSYQAPNYQIVGSFPTSTPHDKIINKL